MTSLVLNNWAPFFKWLLSVRTHPFYTDGSSVYALCSRNASEHFKVMQLVSLASEALE